MHERAPDFAVIHALQTPEPSWGAACAACAGLHVFCTPSAYGWLNKILLDTHGSLCQTKMHGGRDLSSRRVKRRPAGWCIGTLVRCCGA